MQRVFLFLFLLLFSLLPLSTAFAQAPNQKPSEYTKGKVEQVLDEEIDTNMQTVKQSVRVRLLDGEEKNKTVPITYTFPLKSKQWQTLRVGDDVIVVKQADTKPSYSIYDKFRFSNMLILAIGFALLVLIVAGLRGVGSLLGLVISLFVILLFIVPQILAGQDPLFISIVGSLIIMVTTIYLAHGFSQKTTIAIASTFFSLVITGILAVWFVNLLRLTGGGSEDAYMLQFGTQTINLQGLLLGGIIIGTLGVLDDTTTTQTATIFSLADANAKLRTKELIQKGFVVGKEHITSLVNTLVLAYAGASLPLFIFFVLNPLKQPTWVILNNEIVVEEIARTLAGSIGLILAVPITTVLAAFFAKYSLKIK
ncbi:MAG: YibE/F family protein [Candidatus Levybacteria bacterium]|nr:YibE/F family protein [Candidatus Levybacteria bacterium]